MKSGRKPTPTALHKLHGTLNTTRHRGRLEAEPAVDRSPRLEPPDWLTEDQKAGWRYAVEHAPRDVLASIDRGVLLIWVEAEDRHRRAVLAQARLDAAAPLMPFLQKTKDGNVIQSHYLGIINRAAALMLKAASELGFSPAARPRLVAPGESVPLPISGEGDADGRAEGNLDQFLAMHPDRSVN